MMASQTLFACFLCLAICAFPADAGVDLPVQETDFAEVDQFSAVTTASSHSPTKTTKTTKNEFKHILRLKAFCIASRDAAMDQAKMGNTPLLDFVVSFSKMPNHRTNILSEYAVAMGKMKAKYHNGIGDYLLSALDKTLLQPRHSGILRTVGKAKSLTSDKGVEVRLNHKKLGLSHEPAYFRKFQATLGVFNKMETKLKSMASVKASENIYASVWLTRIGNRQYKRHLNTLAKRIAAAYETKAPKKAKYWNPLGVRNMKKWWQKFHHTHKPLTAAQRWAAKARLLTTQWAMRHKNKFGGLAAIIGSSESRLVRHKGHMLTTAQAFRKTVKKWRTYYARRLKARHAAMKKAAKAKSLRNFYHDSLTRKLFFKKHEVARKPRRMDGARRIRPIRRRLVGGSDKHGCNSSLPPRHATKWDPKKKRCVKMFPSKRITVVKRKRVKRLAKKYRHRFAKKKIKKTAAQKAREKSHKASKRRKLVMAHRERYVKRYKERGVKNKRLKNRLQERMMKQKRKQVAEKANKHKRKRHHAALRAKALKTERSTKARNKERGMKAYHRAFLSKKRKRAHDLKHMVLRDGSRVIGNNGWSHYSTCPSHMTALGLQEIDLHGHKGNSDINHEECTMKGCRVWTNHGRSTIKTRCIAAPRGAVKDAPRIRARANGWSSYSTCPRGYRAAGLQYMDNHGNRHNADLNHKECTQTGCRVWMEGATATIGTRCVKHSVFDIKDGPRIRTPKNTWSAYSNCPHGFQAVGLAYMDLHGNRHNSDINHRQCTMRGCRVWTEGYYATIATRCIRRAARRL